MFNIALAITEVNVSQPYSLPISTTEVSTVWIYTWQFTRLKRGAWMVFGINDWLSTWVHWQFFLNKCGKHSIATAEKLTSWTRWSPYIQLSFFVLLFLKGWKLTISNPVLPPSPPPSILLISIKCTILINELIKIIAQKIPGGSREGLGSNPKTI